MYNDIARIMLPLKHICCLNSVSQTSMRTDMHVSFNKCNGTCLPVLFYCTFCHTCRKTFQKEKSQINLKKSLLTKSKIDHLALFSAGLIIFTIMCLCFKLVVFRTQK